MFPLPVKCFQRESISWALGLGAESSLVDITDMSGRLTQRAGFESALYYFHFTSHRDLSTSFLSIWFPADFGSKGG